MIRFFIAVTLTLTLQATGQDLIDSHKGGKGSGAHKEKPFSLSSAVDLYGAGRFVRECDGNLRHFNTNVAQHIMMAKMGPPEDTYDLLSSVGWSSCQLVRKSRTSFTEAVEYFQRGRGDLAKLKRKLRRAKGAEAHELKQKVKALEKELDREVAKIDGFQVETQVDRINTGITEAEKKHGTMAYTPKELFQRMDKCMEGIEDYVDSNLIPLARHLKKDALTLCFEGYDEAPVVATRPAQPNDEVRYVQEEISRAEMDLQILRQMLNQDLSMYQRGAWSTTAELWASKIAMLKHALQYFETNKSTSDSRKRERMMIALKEYLAQEPSIASMGGEDFVGLINVIEKSSRQRAKIKRLDETLQDLIK